MTNHDYFLDLVQQDFDYQEQELEASEREELVNLASEYAPIISIIEVEKNRFVATSNFTDPNFSIEDVDDIFTVKQVSETCIYFKSAQTVDTLRDNFTIAFVPENIF